MNLRVLHNESIDEVASALTLGRLGVASSRRTRRLMEEYCQWNEHLQKPHQHEIDLKFCHEIRGLTDDALRNRDLMEKRRTLHLEKDPFKLVTSKALDKKQILRSPCIAKICRISNNCTIRLSRSYQAIPEHAFCAKERQRGVALVGGMASLISMIIMVLHKGLLTTSLVVSVSVILFAVLVAMYSHQSSVDILTLTAAYAAVLVVFVGSSS